MDRIMNPEKLSRAEKTRIGPTQPMGHVRRNFAEISASHAGSPPLISTGAQRHWGEIEDDAGRLLLQYQEEHGKRVREEAQSPIIFVGDLHPYYHMFTTSSFGNGAALSHRNHTAREMYQDGNRPGDLMCPQDQSLIHQYSAKAEKTANPSKPSPMASRGIKMRSPPSSTHRGYRRELHFARKNLASP